MAGRGAPRSAPPPREASTRCAGSATPPSPRARPTQRRDPRRLSFATSSPDPGPTPTSRSTSPRHESRPAPSNRTGAPLTRFLSREEVYRLHRALDRNAGRSVSARQQADIVRLLLLTGCRRNEVLALRWAEVHPNALALADSKTGPRKVPLNAKAQAVLARQPRGGSFFVFPSPRDSTRPRTSDLALWDTVRREAGLEDVRLHTTVASHAVMNGVPVPVVSRLLGHANVQMTLRHAHLTDRDIEAAAERVSAQMAQVMALGRRLNPEE